MTRPRHLVRWALSAGVVIALLGAAHPEPARAGSPEGCPIDADAVGDDFLALFKAPGEWGATEWTAFAATGAVTAGLVLRWDDDIARVAREDPESFPYIVVRKLAWLGQWYGRNDLNPVITFAAVTGGLFLVGKARDDDYLVRTTGIMTESYAFTAGLTVALKLIFGRARPYTGEDARKWHFVGLHTRDTRSFPSGHASTAFSMAGALTRRHDEWWVQVPAWTLATGFACQRIDSGVHWTSDVLVGAVLGYAVSAFLADRHTCPPELSESGVSSTPYITFGFDF